MEVHLHLERGEWEFTTVHSQQFGPYRALQVKINDRPFAAWYRIDSFRCQDESYLRNVDDMLARQFERMVRKIFLDAVSQVPEGMDLIGARQC